MNRFYRLSFLACSLLLGVTVHAKPSNEPAPPSPGGMWVGTMSFDDGSILKVSGEIDETGRGYLVDTRYTIYSASTPVSTDSSGNVLMQFNEFAPLDPMQGGGQMLGTTRFQGTVVAHTSMSGSFVQSVPTRGSGTGQFLLTYVPTYAMPSSTSLVANTYKYPTRNELGVDMVTLNIDTLGTISGTSELGCVYAGTAIPSKARYNAYALAMTRNCSGGDVVLNGLAAYIPAVSNGSHTTPPALVMEYDDAVTSAIVVGAVGPIPLP